MNERTNNEMSLQVVSYHFTLMTLTTAEIKDEIRRLQLQIQDLSRGQDSKTSNLLGPTCQVLEYSNGDRYEGEVLVMEELALRHGEGIHRCSNGDFYEGGWYYNRRHGTGKLQFRTGSVASYEGEWRDDQTNGSGICLFRDGSLYKGEFANDVRCGWGTQSFTNGEHFEGEWSDDSINGNGRWTMKDGSYLEGQFKNGILIQGKHINKAAQTEYTGSFKNGLPHGEGTLLVNGEWTYKGEFLSGRRSGKGVCEWSEGHCYDGDWFYDQRHGKGTFTFRGHLIYEGEWKEDQKHGQGKMIIASGDVYTGSFNRDAMEGEGIMVYPNGDRYKGEFLQNKRHGLGKCLFKNGDRYKGEWRNDTRHGYGTCRFQDGIKFKGHWRNDHWIQTTASSRKTIVTGEALSKALAGQKASLQIEAHDEEDQRRLSGGDSFQVVLINCRNQLRHFGEVQDHGDGLYTASYELNISGNYDLYILSGDDEFVADSPYSVNLLPAVPNLKNSEIEIPNLEDRVIPIDELFEFFVSPRDQFGNECNYEDVIRDFPIEASLQGRQGQIPATIDLGLDGRYHCSFRCSVAGNYSLFVTSKSKQLPRSPKSIQVGNLDDVTKPTNDLISKWKSIDLELSDDSDSDQEDPEQAFMKKHQDVPVITNLEDLWKLGKLQRERKLKKLAN